MVIGENDSYYGSQKAKNAYEELKNIYQKQGLSEEQINDIAGYYERYNNFYTI